MKGIKNTGLFILLVAFTLFNAVSFLGNFEVTEVQFEKFLADKWIKSEFVAEEGKKKVVGKWNSHFELSAALLTVVEASHDYHRTIIKSLEEAGASKEKIETEWGKVLWIKDTKKHGIKWTLKRWKFKFFFSF